MTVKRKGKYPDYMRSSVSGQFLAKNPIYKPIFMKCVICGKYSLKPVGIDRIKDISEILKGDAANERKCALCGYVHVTNLSVTTTSSEESKPIVIRDKYKDSKTIGLKWIIKKND